MQEQVKQLGEKLQQKEDLIGQHERLVAELQAHIEEMESCESMDDGQEQGTPSSYPLTNNIIINSSNNNKERSNSSPSNYALKRQVSSLQQQLADALDRLKASDVIIAGNHDAIAYLNEEINKWQIGIKTRNTSSPISMANSNSGGTPVDLENTPATSNLLNNPCPDNLREIPSKPSPFYGYPPPTIADDELYGEGAKTANVYLQAAARALQGNNIAYSAPSSSHSNLSPPLPLQPFQSSEYLSALGGDGDDEFYDYDAAFSALYPLAATEAVFNRNLNRRSKAHSTISNNSSSIRGGGGDEPLAAQDVKRLAEDLEALEYYKTGRNISSKNMVAIEDDIDHNRSHRSVKFPDGDGYRSSNNKYDSSRGGNSNGNIGCERKHEGTGCPRIPYTWQSVDLHTTME